ncbi:MAG TPA: hypothetical protein VGG45_18070 [Terracidiphilus sp.]
MQKTNIAGNLNSNETALTSPVASWWDRRLLAPVIAAAVMRFALLAISLVQNGSRVLFQADTVSYLDPGRNLLLHGRFIADGVPDLVRTPGYALFLGLTSLAGLPFAGAVNAVVSVFTIVLVWRLARALFLDDRVAIAAAWIFVFEPISVAFSSTLLSETLFLVPFLICMERLVTFLRSYDLRLLVTAGLSLAIATYIRPISYYLPVLIAMGLIAALARVPEIRWKAPAILLLSALPWLALWQVRNRVETGYSGFSSISDINLYFYDAAGIEARLKHEAFFDLRRELGYVDFSDRDGQSYIYQPYLALHPEQASWTQGQRLTYMHAEGLQVIKAHIGIYFQNVRSALISAIFSPGSGYLYRLVVRGGSQSNPALIDEGTASGGIQLVRKSPWEATEKIVFEAALLAAYVLAILGIVQALRGRFKGSFNIASLWLILGVSTYLLCVAAMSDTAADSRLRMPVMPFICIFMAASIWRTKRAST